MNITYTTPWDYYDKTTYTTQGNYYENNINYYDNITDNIALGNRFASYNDFDIIVNINFPMNNAKLNEITVIKKNNKIIYNIGLYDTENSDIILVFDTMIPILVKYVNENKKILIHCWAGMSRSATLVIVLIAILYNLTYDESYNFVKSKRDIIKPNSGFIQLAKNFINEI
jgi:protein-tyrosine phosphatase